MKKFSFVASLLGLALLLSTAVISDPAASSLTFDTALFTRNDVEVKSSLTGIIDQIFVDRGSRVKRGDRLAKLQNEDLALEIKKAQVSLQEAKAEYERAKSLFEQKLLSESEYDAKRLSFERASAECDLSKVEYEKSIIKAPFNGLVAELYAKVGQRVVEDENVPLFRITAMEPLQARVFVPEEQLSELTVGLKADFLPNISPNRRFSGRVAWISSTIDAASGTAPAIVEILPGQAKGVLKPGTSGKVIIWKKSSAPRSVQ